MNLIRHILSHLTLFFVLAAIGLSYYFRPYVFPEAVNTKINGLVESVYPPAVKLVYTRPQSTEVLVEQTVQAIPQVETSPPVEVMNEAKAEPDTSPLMVVEKEVLAESESIVQKKVEPVPEAKVALPAVGDEQQPAMSEEKMDAVRDEPVQANSTPTVSGRVMEREKPIVGQDNDVGTEQQLLADARRAYQAKDLGGAINKYRQLIALDEHSANAFGELGNIYYLQGKWQEAGAAYYEAAVRLVENGQMQQVAYLYRVIQGLDRTKAEQLAVKMNHGRM